MNTLLTKKNIFLVLGLALFIVIGYLIQVPQGLEQSALANGSSGHSAMIVIASLAFAVCWWAGDVVADWCTALILQAIWIIFAGISFSSTFAAFSESTVWLVVGAFSISTSITKTGLLKRISLSFMKIFPPSFRGQVLAMLCIGTMCSPLMPSSTAKVVLGSRLAESSSELLGFEAFSKGRTGLFLSSWVGFGLMAPAFLSASFLAYTVLGALPEEYSSVSWIQWFIAMIPFMILLLVGMYFYINVVFKPERATTFSREEIQNKHKELGPMSRDEKITAIIVCLCLIFWILERKTGVSAGLVALIGGICCFGFKILKTQEIQTAVPWGFVVFVGVVLNMGRIFSYTGVNDWLLSLIEPVLSDISNYFAIELAVIIITILIRFVIASQTAAIALLVSVLSPIAISINIDPLIIGLTVYMVIPNWIAYYQNPTYLAAFQSMDGTVKHSDTRLTAIFYLLLATGICMLSVLYWGLLGYC